MASRRPPQNCIDAFERYLIELGRHKPVAKAADCRGIGKRIAWLKAGEHHEVDAHLERLLQLRVR